MSLRSSDAPTHDSAYGTSDSASVIDRHSDFDGTYSTERDLRIEGTVRGTLRCQGTLHVAQGATVNAEVEAEEVVVAGFLDGTVTCRTRLQVMPSGELKGRITTPSLVINEGARYEGQMEMPSRNSRLSATRTPTSIGAASAGTTSSEPTSETNEAASSGASFIRRFGTQDTESSSSESANPSSSSSAGA